MENENQMDNSVERVQPLEESVEAVAEQSEEIIANEVPEIQPAAPKKKNGLIIAAAAVLGVVLVGALGLAVLAGTDGMEGVKTKISGWFDKDQKEETPVATEPMATEPPAGEPVNLLSYTVDASEAESIKNEIVANAGNSQISNGILQVYYQTSILSFYSQYGMYLSYMGVDFTQPLDQQIYDQNTNQTWQEFMLQSALETWQLFEAVKQYGSTSEEFGYTLTEAGQEYIAGLPARIQEMAESSGYADVDTFVKEQIGFSATVEGLQNYMENEYYYMCYYTYLQDKLMPTTEQIEQYYTDNEESLTASGISKESEDTVAVRHILIMPESTTAEDGTETISEEAWEAARVEAQELWDQWKNGEATEDTFAQLANEKTQDPGSQTTGGLYEGVKQGQMVTEFNDWIFDETRVKGDNDLIKTSYGYHIMYFVNREPEWIVTCRSSLLNQLLNEKIAEILSLYPLNVDLEKVGLSN